MGVSRRAQRRWTRLSTAYAGPTFYALHKALSIDRHVIALRHNNDVPSHLNPDLKQRDLDGVIRYQIESSAGISDISKAHTCGCLGQDDLRHSAPHDHRRVWLFPYRSRCSPTLPALIPGEVGRGLNINRWTPLFTLLSCAFVSLITLATLHSTFIVPITNPSQVITLQTCLSYFSVSLSSKPQLASPQSVTVTVVHSLRSH